MDMSERERLYITNLWTKRKYNPEELEKQYVKLCLEGTEEARKTIKCQFDVSYGPTKRTKYDIYGTDLPKDAPIFVFIHGGFWKEQDKGYSGFLAPLFVKNKIKVITIEYDLCPTVKLGDIITQIKLAIAQILKYAADSDCKNICVAGHSAGAYLAASLLHDNDWIKRMMQQGYFALLKEIVLISGIYNLEPLVDLQVAKHLQLTIEEAKMWSFSTLVETKNRSIRNLKVIVAGGDADTPVIVKEMREYVQKIISIVDNVEYILLQDVDHYNVTEKFLDPNYYLAKLILKCLQPDKNIH